MTFHREGNKIILGLFIVLTLINSALSIWVGNQIITATALFASLIVFILVAQFFRVPKKTLSAAADEVVSPADGKVVAIEEVFESEYLETKAIQVSVFMSPLNVHVNFNPISGVVKYFKYHKGLYLVAWHPKSSTDNERTTVVTEDAKGRKVLFRQIAGAVARRICWYVKEGDQVEQGKEFGFIKFGSRVDILLPIGSEIKVKIDDKVKGIETVLAKLP
jgi:phosphatidylserine decarboxylase